MKNQKVTINPARLVSNRKVVSGVLRYLLKPEEDRLRAVIERRFPHHMPELVIALNTGMRKSEQYGLLWADVDFGERRIMAHNTKNGTPRTIHMNDDALMAMNELRKAAKSDNLIIPSFAIPSTVPKSRFAIFNSWLGAVNWTRSPTENALSCSR
jgi:integrase